MRDLPEVVKQEGAMKNGIGRGGFVIGIAVIVIGVAMVAVGAYQSAIVDSQGNEIYPGAEGFGLLGFAVVALGVWIRKKGKLALAADRARCSCGWVSDSFTKRDAAEADGNRHVHLTVTYMDQPKSRHRVEIVGPL